MYEIMGAFFLSVKILINAFATKKYLFHGGIIRIIWTKRRRRYEICNAVIFSLVRDNANNAKRQSIRACMARDA